MASSAGVRDHLFCLGIDLPRDTRGRARGPAIPAGSYAVFRGWLDPVCLDAPQRLAISELARVGGGIVSGHAHLRGGLRMPLLGGAACSVRNRGGHTGDHSCVHHSLGDHISANAAPHPAPCHRAAGRHLRRCRANEPFGISRRSSCQSCRGWRIADCSGYVVNRDYFDQADSTASVQADERGGTDAYGWRSAFHRGGETVGTRTLLGTLLVLVSVITITTTPAKGKTEKEARPVEVGEVA